MFFKKFKKNSEVIDYLIVGLGNPGLQYEMTRHNVGFLAIDYIAQQLNVKIKKLKFKALYNITEIKGKKVMLLKPQTFMNNSGESVRDAMEYYKITPQQLLVIFDDISLAPGKIRIRRKGSDGGHNGIKSIIYHIKSQDFKRIKIGVGEKPHPDYDLAKWVLSNFKKDEIKDIKQAVENTENVVKLIINNEIDKAMNLYNS